MVPRNAGRHDGERPFGTTRPNSHRLEFKSMWSQAQRYLFRQTAVALAVAGSAVAILLWLAYSLRFFDLIVSHGLPASTLFALMALNLPRFVATALPLALAAAILFVFHRLWSDSELVALRAAGLSDLRLAAGPLTVAALATVLTASITLWIAPEAARAFRELHHGIRHDLVAIAIQPGRFQTPSPGLTLYARRADGEGHYGGMLVNDARRPDRRTTLIAATGRLVRGEDGPRIVLINGSRHDLDVAAGRLSVVTFDRYEMPLTDALSAVQREPAPAELPLATLLARHGDARAEGHQRLASILLPGAMALTVLAVFLAGRSWRAGRGRRLWAAAGAAVALQSMTLAVRYGAARQPWLLPAIYLLPLLASAAAVTLLLLRRSIAPIAAPGAAPYLAEERSPAT